MRSELAPNRSGKCPRAVRIRTDLAWKSAALNPLNLESYEFRIPPALRLGVLIHFILDSGISDILPSNVHVGCRSSLQHQQAHGSKFRTLPI
jgi:hypothetical protein